MIRWPGRGRGRSTSTLLLVVVVLLSFILEIESLYGINLNRVITVLTRRPPPQECKPDSIVAVSYERMCPSDVEEWIRRKHLLLSYRGGGGQGGSWLNYIVRTLKHLIKKAVGGLSPKPVSFIETFEKQYGRRHPQFLSLPTLKQAANSARLANKFLMIYCPSSSPRDAKRHATFCKTLTDPEVIRTVQSSMVVWVPSADSVALKAAVKDLKGGKVPYLAIVQMAEKTRKLAVKSIHHFKPPPEPEQMLLWVNRTMEIHKGALEQDKAEQEKAVREARLVVEQKAEFIKALKEDRQRAEKEAEELKQRLAREEAEREKAAEDAARRAKKREALEMEAEPSPGHARIMLKLANGTKVQRSFGAQDRMEKLFDWADVEGLDLEKSKVVLNRPRRAFTYPEDNKVTIEEAGLAGQVLLFIEPR